MRPYETSQAGHVAIEEGTICDHMSPTDRPHRRRGRDPMRPYEASQVGHGAIEEGTVCDRMSPNRSAASP